jgi:hypothetical protein
MKTSKISNGKTYTIGSRFNMKGKTEMKISKQTQSIKAGTRIEFHGTPAIGGFPAVAPEGATIGRWIRKNGSIKNHINPTCGGWHVVKFDNGSGTLIAHESRFRIISNR